MNENIGKLTPKDCYTPIRSSVYEDEAMVLSHLYQPIIGREAMSLYQFLEGEAKLGKREATHHTLMSYLGLPLDRVYDARVQLEAIGLLKTYRREETQRNSYVYRLVPPFSSSQFFRDHMLTLLLMHEIGEDKFIRLRDSFDAPSPVGEGFEEVTSSFTDVFRPVASLPENMKETEEKVVQEGVVLGESPVDFEWLEKSLRDHMLPAGKILGNENRRLIDQLAVLYRVTTADMEKALLWSLDEKNELDREELKAACHDLAEQTVVTPAENVSGEDRKEKRKEPVTKNEKFIQMLEDISPRELLEDVADGKKATDQDVKLIREVMTEQGLPKGVMNVLVHYVLLKTDMKLSKPYLEKIAGHWARKNVKTVEQAMNMARAEHNKYQQWSRDKQNAKARTKEVLPEWYKEQKQTPAEKKTKENTPTSEDEIAQRIQRITQKRKGR